jgi:hypothetical protein
MKFFPHSIFATLAAVFLAAALRETLNHTIAAAERVTALEAQARVRHGPYKANLADGVNTVKEYRLPSGMRIDFLDIPNRTIYELKPYNPRSIQQGEKQLLQYFQGLQNVPELRGNWNLVLETY